MARPFPPPDVVVLSAGELTRYEAWQTALNRAVAVKTVLGQGAASPAERTRFHAEALATARLQHPNIVQIHEVGAHDGCPYFVLELCGGGSLADRLVGEHEGSWADKQEPRRGVVRAASAWV